MPLSAAQCGPDTHLNSETGRCEISCEGDGRQLKEEAPVENGAHAAAPGEASAAEDIIDSYLLSHPRLAAKLKLDPDLLKEIIELVGIGELFGQPADA